MAIQMPVDGIHSSQKPSPREHPRPDRNGMKVLKLLDVIERCSVGANLGERARGATMATGAGCRICSRARVVRDQVNDRGSNRRRTTVVQLHTQ